LIYPDLCRGWKAGFHPFRCAIMLDHSADACSGGSHQRQERSFLRCRPISHGGALYFALYLVVMSEQTKTTIVWTCPVPGHEHATWEDAETCTRLYPQVEKLEHAVSEITRACVQLLEALRQAMLAHNKSLQQAYKAIYPHLKAQYQNAGSPYGETDAGMWRWLRDKMETQRRGQAGQ